MGAKPVKSQPLKVSIEVKQRQIVFHAETNCQHSIEFLGKPYILYGSDTITVNDLQPNTKYTYIWNTLEIGKTWSDMMYGSFVTRAIVDQVYVISGSKEAIFSIKEEDVELLEAVEVELFDNQGLLLKKFYLNPIVRTFRVAQLKPASLHIYTFKAQTNDGLRPTATKKGEFFTKKPHDFSSLFQKDETFIINKINQLKRDLSQLQIPQGYNDINLLVVGRPGAGKSSCLNTIVSSIDGKYVALASTGSSTASFTNKIDYIKLGENFNINLVDIFGFDASQKDHHLKIVGKLINGEISAGFRKSMLLESEDIPYRRKKNRQVNGFLIVVDQQSLDNNIVQKDLSPYFEKIRQTNLPYIVVLTQIDKLFGEEMLQTQEIFEHPKVAERLEKAKQTLGLDCIYPQVNYTCPYVDRDYYKECLTLELVFRVADSATRFLQNENYKNQFNME